ncbi:hypothetical protein FG386_001217 [Cryptosporidium ryanae]|uniref:uncharacterized protein n=1 Tax=Cryptosporidium ryanae TaxID=515981 RepID=UPI00351AA10A|nr:hypothetical protein FG386_001217 [Cryptosporidium ryanae]
MKMENRTPNTVTEDEIEGDNKKDQKLNSILNWNKMLDFGQNSVKSKRRRKNSKPFHKQKSPLFSNDSANKSVSPVISLSSSGCLTTKSNSSNRGNNALKRQNYFNEQFGINRVYFEEFPIYRKEFLNPRTKPEGNNNKKCDNFYLVGSIKEEIKLVSRYKNNQCMNNLVNYFQDKKICLVENDEYLFHSRNQLLLKLEWYGAKVLNYYSSRTDYVVCSSTYNEVLDRIIKTRNNAEEEKKSDAVMKVIEGSKHTLNEDKNCVVSNNLRGVNIGKQLKLTEIELLEFLGEEFDIAVNSLNASKSLTNDKNTGILYLTRPRTIWEVIGNRDSMDELYTSLLNLRIHCEDLTFLSDTGLGKEALFGGGNPLTLCGSTVGSGGGCNSSNRPGGGAVYCSSIHYCDELCGIYLCISPNNVGAQVSTELTAIGCGYEVKLYKGSDVVDPIIKQWKKGHFFKIFGEAEPSPPLCTIMSDCSNVIKPNDLIKIRNSYYSSVNAFHCDTANGDGKKSRGKSGLGANRNPGAIIFVLEEASEIGQYILNHCNGSNRSYGCSRSYTLYKLDGTGTNGSYGNSGIGLNSSQKRTSNCMLSSIKVVKFKELSKSSVLCKLFTKFENPLLINALMVQFGSNLLKISNMLHWMHLIRHSIKDNVEGALKTLSLYYSPVLVDSTIETPLVIIQKCMLNHDFSSIKDEIWNNSTYGFLEEQLNILNNLCRVLHDVVTSVISFSEDEDYTIINHNKTISLKDVVDVANNQELRINGKTKYSNGFRDTQYMIDNAYVQDNVSIYSLFLRGISEMDTMYQLEHPHLTYHTGDSLGTNSHGNTGNHNYNHGSNVNFNNTNCVGNNCTGGFSGNSTHQHMAERMCESYFSTLYTYCFYGLVSVLNNSFKKETFGSKKVLNVVNGKLFRYSPIGSNYNKCSGNYYSNKRQENVSNWRYIEYFLKSKAKSSGMSAITWRSVSTDSNIVNLLHKKSNFNSCHDVVSYVPSKIPKLSIRMPDVFKQK